MPEGSREAFSSRKAGSVTKTLLSKSFNKLTARTRSSQRDGNLSSIFEEITISQSGDESDQLRIRIVTAKHFLPVALWAKYRQHWVRIQDLTTGPLNTSGASPNPERTISQSLRALEARIADSAPELLADGAGGIPRSVSVRLELFVEYEHSQGEELPLTVGAHASTQSESVLYPIGHAPRTYADLLVTVETERGNLTPFLNRSRWLAVSIDQKPTPSIKVFNNGLKVVDGVLTLEGLIDAAHTKMASAELVITGRTTSYQVSVSSDLKHNEQISSDNHGHYFYDFRASYDFRPNAATIPDDIADLHLVFQPAGGADTIRKRIGISRYLVRRTATSSVVRYDDRALSIVPYYTFGAKNPSLQFENFSAEAYDHLERVMTRGHRTPKPSRPVWVIGEVPYKAQDNGLWFFKFMRDNHPEVDAYFVLGASSPDRKNLAGYEKHVVDFRSRQHIDLLLVADRVIGTHQPLQLYPTRDRRFRRQLRAGHVFLQHGITAAKWIAPVNGRNASDFHSNLIIVASEREKEFFVKDCGYHPNEVAVTGFARFDALFADDVSKKPKQLLIMPTWRPWLQDPATFEESKYFDRWMSLLTGDALADLRQKHALEIVFCLHPNMQQYSDRFQGLGVEVVYQGQVDVQHLLKESAVMLTDYSSVAFDFTFLEKPAVFYQFDPEEFSAPHADPFTELPGPVLADEQSVVSYLDRRFADESRIESEYNARATRFLAHRDTHNRERIHLAIKDLRPRREVVEDFANSDLGTTAFKMLREHRNYLKFLRYCYRFFSVLPLRSGLIVFESDLARGFKDSPAAIYGELIARGDQRPKVIVSNRRVHVKRDQNTMVVKRHSIGFAWHLARAEFWVNNQNFPDYVVRRKRTNFIQTWHGTPLKRMFLDQPNFFGRDAGYIDRTKKMAAQWNRLVSPSEFTTNAIRSSYAYRGPAFELGYPRNDILSSDTRDEIGRSIRLSLGIPENKFVVLYAPTFRDDKPTSRGRFAFDWPFDPREFIESVGENVVLLVRTHNLVNTRVAIPSEVANRVIDVTRYPDMNRLFLATDMLVTDYSSSFFDYSILRRPMAFFAYDLERYRDDIRGFYLDYDSELPGPILTEREELYCEVRNQAAESGSFTPSQLDEFVSRFAPHDDGNASARVVDRLL